jgi:NAD(P)-dependent dehydrogenase (short-subunit alcohol dehydrogenase family)
MSVSGKVVLITGAGQGIGKAIGTVLARNGAVLVFSDAVEERAESTARELKNEGLKASHIRLDVSDITSIEDAFSKTLQQHGRLDVLVNNAGIGINAPFVDFKPADFELSLKINLTGAFLCGQFAARQMLRQKSGKIINIVSLSGQRGGMGRAGYGASKAGLELLTKVMAVELAGEGINVNAIAPGPIDTELSRIVHAAGGTRDAYLFLTPQHRYGDPYEIASAALFLASDQSDYVNGHILNVDGGFGAAGLMYPLPSNPPQKP